MKNKSIIFAAVLVSTLPMYSMMITRRGATIFRPQVIQKRMGSLKKIEDIQKKIELQAMADLNADDLREGVEYLDIWACSEACGTNKPCRSPYCGRNFYSDSENGIDEVIAKKNRDDYLKKYNADEGVWRALSNLKIYQNELDLLVNAKVEVKKRIVNFDEEGREFHSLCYLEHDLKHKERCMRNKVKGHRNYVLQQYYAQAAEIGSIECSTAHQSSGTCTNPLCYRVLDFGSNTFTYDQWKEAEVKRQMMKCTILKKIDSSSESRFEFVKKAHAAIQELSIVYVNAHEQLKAGGDFEEYTKVRDLIDHKHDCLLAQLRIIEEDNHITWQQYEKVTFGQWLTDVKKMDYFTSHISDIINIAQQEPVSAVAMRLLGSKVRLASEFVKNRTE